MTNDLICFIPARSGSKSIPDKNIKLLGDKPLLAWSIETSLKAELRTITNSDSEEYLKIAKKYGSEVMLRPKELGGDAVSMYELLAAEVPKIEPIPEYIVLLQPTTPFRSVNKVKIALSYLLNNPEYDSLVIAERVPDKYAPELMIINTPTGLRMANGLPIPQRITARQNHKEAWIPSGTYIFKTANLEEGSMYGAKTMILETEADSPNINNLRDWEEAEKICKS